MQLSDPQMRDPLALFTAVLIARSCISLEDVIKHVAIPSLLAACNDNSAADLHDPSVGKYLDIVVTNIACLILEFNYNVDVSCRYFK